MPTRKLRSTCDAEPRVAHDYGPLHSRNVARSSHHLAAAASTTAQLVAMLYWQEALNHVQCRQLDRQLLEAMKSA